MTLRSHETPVHDADTGPFTDPGQMPTPAYGDYGFNPSAPGGVGVVPPGGFLGAPGFSPVPVPVPMPRAVAAIDPLSLPGSVAGSLSDTQATASIGDGTSATLDFSTTFTALKARARGAWRIVGCMGVIQGAGTGPFYVSTWQAGDMDLGQTLLARTGIFVPMDARCPVQWDGRLTVLCTNHTGGGAALHLTLFLGWMTGKR